MQLIFILLPWCLLCPSAACDELFNWLWIGPEWIWCWIWPTQDIDNVDLGEYQYDNQIWVTSRIKKRRLTLTSIMWVCQNLITSATPSIDIMSPWQSWNNWQEFFTPHAWIQIQAHYSCGSHPLVPTRGQNLTFACGPDVQICDRSEH